MPVGVVDERMHLLRRVHPRHGLEVFRLFPESILRQRPGERVEKLLFELVQFDAVLRPLGTRHAGRHRTQVQLQFLRIGEVSFLRNAEQTLGAEIVFVKPAVLLAAAGRTQVIHTLGVHREESHRRAVLGRHVRDGGAVHHRQRRRARSIKFDELAHHFHPAEHLGDGEREVGGGHTFAQFAHQLDAHHVWREKIDRLPEHTRFGLDAPHTPADDAQAVDHRRVRVGADQRVRVEEGGWFRVDGCWAAQHAFGQILQIDLVDDPDARGHDLESIKRLHAPFQKLVTLAIAPELHFQVPLHGVGCAGEVHLHRVIHHQVHRHQRLDDFWLPPQPRHRRAHRGQVHQQRHTGEILQYDSRDDERDFPRALRMGRPVRQRLQVAFGHFAAVAVAQDRLQHQPDGDGQFRHRP